jgi:type IV pilus assembly protein PilM
MRLTSFVQLLGSDMVSLETSSLSVHRIFYNKSSSMEGALLICHMGALSTDIQIMSAGTLLLTHSVPTGGLALTRAVEKGLGLDPSQAEEYKRTYGLDESQLEGRVSNVLLPVLNSILTEVRKTAQYFQSENSDKPIKEILLSGGGAYLPNLTTYMANTFAIPVGIGNPTENFSVQSGIQVSQQTASFSVAVGLAVKEE